MLPVDQAELAEEIRNIEPQRTQRGRPATKKIRLPVTAFPEIPPAPLCKGKL